MESGAPLLGAGAEARRIQSFSDFWPHYVAAHRKPLTRALHYVGTGGAVTCVVAAALTGDWRWFLAAPLAGYAFAWGGHFFVEGNRPATFGHPAYSLMADFKMLGLALRGKMRSEAARVLGAG